MNGDDCIERLRSQLEEHTTAFVLLYQAAENEEGNCMYGGNYLACHHMAENGQESFTEQVTADCEDDLIDLEDEDEDEEGDQLAKV